MLIIDEHYLRMDAESKVAYLLREYNDLQERFKQEKRRGRKLKKLLSTLMKGYEIDDLFRTEDD